MRTFLTIARPNVRAALGVVLLMLANSGAATELCATKGDNYIQDADFALEAADV